MDDEDDLLSIEDEIEKERKFFNNRLSGVSILQTCNILNDIWYFEFNHFRVLINQSKGKWKGYSHKLGLPKAQRFHIFRV